MWLPISLLAVFLGEPTRSFEDVMSEANAARTAGDMERALELLDEAYKIRRDPRLLHNIGTAREALGRYDLAVEAYERVAKDPDADPLVRSTDEQRIEQLRPKLPFAHIDAPRELAAASWFDGKRLDSGERAVAPGRHTLERFEESSGTVELTLLELAAGRRHDLGALHRQSMISVGVLELDAPSEAISIDGVPLASPLDRARALKTKGGRHFVELTRGGDTQMFWVQLSVEPVKVSRYLDSLAVGRSLSQAAPPPAEARYVGLKAAAVGIGAALVGAGAALLVTSESDRSFLREQGLLSSATVTRAEARHLEDSANARTVTGWGLGGGGLALATGALLWWILDDP